ncbi:M50 family metallopeptidase [Gehongia tenuis]|uniref:M50 family metallopeptidase n=1 Tax=Gehongia tenuis TaxID=2763655 RepID=A0A926HL05_9FIRM|nr:M50 family metallopeptidase [Gehongia tenuis]
MKLGNLLGVDIYVRPLFFIVLVLLSILGFFHDLVVVFLIILAHEACHALAARALGLTVLSIEILPFGGVARIEGVFEAGPVKEMLVAIAGPLCNLVLAGIAVLIHLYFPMNPETLSSWVNKNLVLAGINLLPALPLDGGRILRSVLSFFMGPQTATRIAIVMGYVFGGLLLALCGYLAAAGQYNVTLILFAFFLFLAAHGEHRKAPYLLAQNFMGKRDLLRRSKVLPARQLTALEDQSLGGLTRSFLPGRYTTIQVLDDRMRIRGSVTEGDVLQGISQYGAEAPVGRLLH